MGLPVPFLAASGHCRPLVLVGALLLLSGCSQSPPPEELSPASRQAVNSGYGLEAREHSTATVSSATAAELGNVRVRQVEELIAGRFAGVQVLQTPTGGFSLRIRGLGTFVGNPEPLYVIDGMPVSVAAGRGIEWLNPSDIARIDVLKDAASTSAFGMRGANGVVLITTKRGQ